MKKKKKKTFELFGYQTIWWSDYFQPSLRSRNPFFIHSKLDVSFIQIPTVNKPKLHFVQMNVLTQPNFIYETELQCASEQRTSSVFKYHGDSFNCRMVHFSSIWIANYLSNKQAQVCHSDVSAIQIPTVLSHPFVEKTFCL